MTKRTQFRYFKMSPEIIRLAVMMYIRFPLSLRNVEEILHEQGIDVSHETIRFFLVEQVWPNIRGLDTKGSDQSAAITFELAMASRRGFRENQWRNSLSVAGSRSSGQVLEGSVTKRRNLRAALKFLRKSLKRFG